MNAHLVLFCRTDGQKVKVVHASLLKPHRKSLVRAMFLVLNASDFKISSSVLHHCHVSGKWLCKVAVVDMYHRVLMTKIQWWHDFFLSWASSDDVWIKMLNKELKYVHDKSFLEQHPSLKPKMRSILLDWLLEVRTNLFPEYTF